MEPDLLLKAEVHVGDVAGVSQRVGRHRVAVTVDEDLSATAFTGQVDRDRAVRVIGENLAVFFGRRERNRRGTEAGRVLGALDQKAVTVVLEAVLELVDDRGMGRSPPGFLVIRVAGEDQGAGVESQVLAGGRTADA